MEHSGLQVHNERESQRAVFQVIASIGARHTATPARAWFAVWVGHGLEWHEPASGVEAERASQRLLEFGRRHNAALHQIPRFDCPRRSYYLLNGTVASVTELQTSVSPVKANWHEPDFFWPDDKRWFVATDTDLNALYVAGDEQFISELAQSIPRHCEFVDSSTRLSAEA